MIGGNKSRPTERRKRFGLQRYSSVELLAALILLFVAAPFVEDLPHGNVIETGLMTLALVSAVFAVGGRRRTLVVGKWLGQVTHHIDSLRITREVIVSAPRNASDPGSQPSTCFLGSSLESHGCCRWLEALAPWSRAAVCTRSEGFQPSPPGSRGHSVKPTRGFECASNQAFGVFLMPSGHAFI